MHSLLFTVQRPEAGAHTPRQRQPHSLSQFTYTHTAHNCGATHPADSALVMHSSGGELNVGDFSSSAAEINLHDSQPSQPALPPNLCASTVEHSARTTSALGPSGYAHPIGVQSGGLVQPVSNPRHSQTVRFAGRVASCSVQ